MSWMLRIALVLLAAALTAGGVFSLYVKRSLPIVSGVLMADGLQGETTVERDASDVTHIKAGSPRDAWFSLGFVHAQERSWQLEFNRRVMRGELAAILGPGALDTDRLLRTLGVIQAAQRQLEGLPPQARQALEAYSDGVNAFHASNSQALSPEFLLLGIKPGRWTPQDSVGWLIMMALDLGGNWGTEFARLSAAQVLDTERLWQLFPPYVGEPPAAKADLSKLYADLGIYRPLPPDASRKAAVTPDRLATDPVAVAQADWLGSLGHSEGKGSNNWVIAGTRTASGKPLLANDPHLSLSAPAIWYFARLQAPGLNVVGATLPGLPFVVLGRTEGVAWGFTNTGPDVQDLYIEQINPDNPAQYRTPDGWADFITRDEVIQVKGQPEVRITVRSTRHGPVISDAQTAHRLLIDTRRHVLALRWTALDDDNRTAAAGLAANQANSIDELKAAYVDYHAPMQNVVMADLSGAIAYKAVGRAPVRKPGNDIRGVAPSPGWDPRYDWDGWIPSDQLPEDDGSRGWIATANQRIHAADYPHFLGQDWVAPWRQQRIEQLIESRPVHDLASMRAIQADTLSLATAKLLPYLDPSQSRHRLARAASRVLIGFDGDMRADSAAATIYAVWADELTRLLFIHRLGEQRFKAMYGKRLFRTSVEGIMERNDTYWCGEGGCNAVSRLAFDRTLDRLAARYGSQVHAWRWGPVHEAVSGHRPFGNVAALAPTFDVRIATPGDPFTVNVGQYHVDRTDNPFANRHAASLRAIYDLSDIENNWFIYQTGQSGVAFDRRYRDMSEEWAQVLYRPLRMNSADVRQRLSLRPLRAPASEAGGS